MTTHSNTAKREEDLQALQGSTLKLNMKFVWRVGFRTEQAGYLRSSRFLSLLFIFCKCLLVWGGLHPSPAT